jgi:hypothetical protein
VVINRKAIKVLGMTNVEAMNSITETKQRHSLREAAIPSTSVWRVRMKPDGVDAAAARQFAIDNGIVGAGWALNDPPDPSPLPDGCDDLNLYKKHAKLVYPDDRSADGAAYSFGEMKLGDFCWMYVTNSGEY